MLHRIGAILLVAGTCIGSGMIALPMVLAKLGLIPSIALMLFMWFIMYFTSLINLELNLQAGEGLSLGSLGRHYSGKIAELIGVSSLKLLTYALIAVYIYGGTSILQELNAELPFKTIATIYACVVFLLLLLPMKLVDYVNRFLFVGLICVVTVLIAGLTYSVEWTNMPLIGEKAFDIKAWRALLPVVMTSFGFQVIFHTLTNYCNKNAKMLKQAFFIGSLIPAIVYILWTSSVLSVVHHDNPVFYGKMAAGNVEVGELIEALSHIAKWQSVQLLVWWISIFAIATSILGVGVGLCDAINGMLAEKIPHSRMKRKALSSLLTVLPAYMVAIYVPNAFIAALGFAGMILAIIAILLPVYLFRKIDISYYPELKNKGFILISVLTGIAVIVSEIFNMILTQ